MFCPKCNAAIVPGGSFCGACGSPINNQNAMPQVTQVASVTPANNSVPNNNQNAIPQAAPVASVAPANNSVPNNNQNVEDALIRAYIGKNVDKLMNGKFNCPALFFSTAYFFYRKMWILGLIWFFGLPIIIGLLYVILPTIAPIISLALATAIASQFNKLYLKNVKEKVNSIIVTNPGASPAELTTICAQKGGTAIWPVIVYCVLYGIVAVVAIIMILAAATLGL